MRKQHICAIIYKKSLSFRFYRAFFMPAKAVLSTRVSLYANAKSIPLTHPPSPQLYFFRSTPAKGSCAL